MSEAAVSSSYWVLALTGFSNSELNQVSVKGPYDSKSAAIDVVVELCKQSHAGLWFPCVCDSYYDNNVECDGADDNVICETMERRIRQRECYLKYEYKGGYFAASVVEGSTKGCDFTYYDLDGARFNDDKFKDWKYDRDE